MDPHYVTGELEPVHYAFTRKTVTLDALQDQMLQDVGATSPSSSSSSSSSGDREAQAEHEE